MIAAVRALTVAVALVCTWMTAMSSAYGIAPVQVADGWWWSVQPDPPILPAPPTVPSDGLRVSLDPVGEESVTAVRVQPSPELRAVRLTLRIATQRGLVAGSLRAQVLTAPFEDGVRAGSWSTRPQGPAAAPMLPVTVDTGAGLVVVDLRGQTTAAVAILLSAAPAAAGQPVPDVEVTFEAVRPQDVATTSAEVAAPAAPAPSGQDGFVPAGGSASAPFAPPAPPILSGTAPEPALPSAPEPIQAPVVAGPTVAAPPIGTLPVAVTRPDPPKRRLGLAVLAVLVGLVVLQQGAPRRPRLSLHGRPEPDSAGPATVAAAGPRRPRPPRLR